MFVSLEFDTRVPVCQRVKNAFTAFKVGTWISGWDGEREKDAVDDTRANS